MANLLLPKFAVFFVKKSHCQTKNVEKTKNQMFWHLYKLYFRWKYISMITLPVFFKFLKNYIIWGKMSWLKYVTADNLSKNTILLQCVTTWHLFSHDSYIESGFFLKKIGEFWSTQICHGAMVLNTAMKFWLRTIAILWSKVGVFKRAWQP